MNPSTAELRCGHEVPRVRYPGVHRWSVNDRPGPDSEVAAAVRAALDLVGDVPSSTKAAVNSANAALGSIENDTLPTDRWIVDLNGRRTSMSVRGGLDAALLACLEAIRLRPASASSIIPVSLSPFTPDSLAQASHPETWAGELARAITTHLQSAIDPGDGAARAIASLEALGHDRYHYGSSDDSETWFTGERRSTGGAGMRIDLAYRAYEDPVVEVVITKART